MTLGRCAAFPRAGALAGFQPAVCGGAGSVRVYSRVSRAHRPLLTVLYAAEFNIDREGAGLAPSYRRTVVQDRDRELLELLRGVVARSTAFIEQAESDRLSDLAFADGLGVLISIYRDIAAQLSARTAALYATNQWASPALPTSPMALPSG
jgi:hypothetical protein